MDASNLNIKVEEEEYQEENSNNFQEDIVDEKLPLNEINNILACYVKSETQIENLPYTFNIEHGAYRSQTLDTQSDCIKLFGEKPVAVMTDTGTDKIISLKVKKKRMKKHRMADTHSERIPSSHKKRKKHVKELQINEKSSLETITSSDLMNTLGKNKKRKNSDSNQTASYANKNYEMSLEKKKRKIEYKLFPHSGDNNENIAEIAETIWKTEDNDDESDGDSGDERKQGENKMRNNGKQQKSKSGDSNINNTDHSHGMVAGSYLLKHETEEVMNLNGAWKEQIEDKQKYIKRKACKLKESVSSQYLLRNRSKKMWKYRRFNNVRSSVSEGIIYAPYECNTCGRMYRRECSLKVHLKTHSRPNSIHTSCTLQKPFQGRKKRHTTRTSVKSLADEKLFRDINIQKNSYKCNVCGMCFSRKAYLKVHARIHTGEKPCKCLVCGRCFSQKSALNTHHRVVHIGSKPYKCDTCDKLFSLKGNLKTHIRVHTADKPYLCAHCGKCFTQKCSLNTHVKVLHTSENPYQCDSCDKVFSLERNLKKYGRSHTGEKPYACDVCCKSFSQKSRLNSHRKMLHGSGRQCKWHKYGNLGPKRML